MPLYWPTIKVHYGICLVTSLRATYFFLFKQAAKWVTQVLKFLPDNLIDLFSDLQGNSKHQDKSGSKELQWHEDVKRFLRRNPPPTREELAKARKAAEVIPENRAKKQGRVLVHR